MRVRTRFIALTRRRRRLKSPSFSFFAEVMALLISLAANYDLATRPDGLKPTVKTWRLSKGETARSGGTGRGSERGMMNKSKKRKTVRLKSIKLSTPSTVMKNVGENM